MRSYWLPDFQSRLLGELQRQQNNTLFCDTLLQTEGVSVPVHGCVVAALSPYLSQKLSASPCPPAGQQCRVKLPAVSAQTLVKLVGLCYSGLLEADETTDRADVLAAARRLGFDRLVDGREDARGDGDGAGQLVCGGCGEAGSLAEEAREERENPIADARVEGTGFVDATTQNSGAQGAVRPRSSPRPGPTAAPLDETRTSNEVTEIHPYSSTGGTGEPSGHTGPRRPSAQRNNRRTCTRETAGGSRRTEAAGGGLTRTGGKETRRRGVRIGGGRRNPSRRTATGLVETREIAIKVKLRRIKQGATWEVVNMQDIGQRLTTEGSQAVFAALQKEGAGVESAAPVSRLRPGNKPRGPVTSPARPERPPPASALRPRGPGEESDDELEKLLEEIMMKILPCAGCSPFTGEPPAPDRTGRHGEADGAAAVGGADGPRRDETASEDALSKDTAFGLPSRCSSGVVPATTLATSVHCAATRPQTESECGRIAQVHSSWAEERPEIKDGAPHQSFTPCRSLKHKRPGDTMDRSDLRSEPLDSQYLRTLEAGSIGPDTVHSGVEETMRPALKGLTWLSETPQALRFPLSLGFKEGTKPSEPCDPHRPESMELLESFHHSTQVPRRKRKQTARTPCVTRHKEGTRPPDWERWTGPISSRGNVRSKDPQLKPCEIKDKQVMLKVRRKCEAHTDPAWGHKQTRHGDGECSQIVLKMCSVRLSHNNVLIKDRTLDKESRKEVRDVTDVGKVFKKLKVDQTITKTPTRTTPHTRRASRAQGNGVKHVEAVKRKRERPPKIKIVPDKASRCTEESHTLEGDYKVAIEEENDNAPKRKHRRKILENKNIVCGLEISNNVVHDVQSLPLWVVSALKPESPLGVENRPQTAGPEDTHTAEGSVSGHPDSTMNPAVKPEEEPKHKSTMYLKEFKEVVKYRHVKTRRSQTKTEVGENTNDKVHFDGRTCDNTDSCEVSAAETIIGLDTEHRVEPVMGIKKSVEIGVEPNDFSGKDIRFQSNKGDQGAGESETEEMGVVVLDGGPDGKCLLEWPDEELDMAISTERPQDPVKDFSLCCASPTQQSNMTTTDYAIASETPDKMSRDTVGSRHFQEDEEDFEVDILICSPEKGPPIEFGENVSIYTSSDEDEEELEEIDVTGI